MKNTFVILPLILLVSCKPELEKKNLVNNDICVASSANIKINNSWINRPTPPHLSTKQFVEELKASGFMAEPNYHVQIMGEIHSKISIKSSSITTTWDDEDSNADEVWSLHGLTGSLNEKVAILDTGVDFTHQDLDNNIPADIKNSSTALVLDKIDYDNNPMDLHGHGTHVAGIVGAEHATPPGDSLVRGINDNVTILPVRVLDENGSGAYLGIAEGIDEAISYGAHVINMSLGAYAPQTSLMFEAVKRAVDAGLVVVIAAGNAAFDNNTYASYPANTALEGVISVGSHYVDGDESYFTNFGTQAVHLTAPGHYIASTIPGQDYAYSSGTSMAAPQVSGAIALLQQHARTKGGAYTADPRNISPLVRSALLHSTTARNTRTITQGALNVKAAIDFIDSGIVAAPSMARSTVGRSFRLIAAGGTAPYTFSYESGELIGVFQKADGTLDATQTTDNDEAWFTVTQSGAMSYRVTDSNGAVFVGTLDSRPTADKDYDPCE